MASYNKRSRSNSLVEQKSSSPSNKGLAEGDLSDLASALESLTTVYAPTTPSHRAIRIYIIQKDPKRAHTSTKFIASAICDEPSAPRKNTASAICGIRKNHHKSSSSLRARLSFHQKSLAAEKAVAKRKMMEEDLGEEDEEMED
jgi:hypothetical protein